LEADDTDVVSTGELGSVYVPHLWGDGRRLAGSLCGGEAAGGVDGGVDIDGMELKKRRVGGAPCLRNS
jgi:hypothetical protein